VVAGVTATGVELEVDVGLVTAKRAATTVVAGVTIVPTDVG